LDNFGPVQIENIKCLTPKNKESKFFPLHKNNEKAILRCFIEGSRFPSQFFSGIINPNVHRLAFSTDRKIEIVIQCLKLVLNDILFVKLTILELMIGLWTNVIQEL